MILRRQGRWFFECIQRMIQITDDVIDVFNADANTNRFGANAGLTLFYGRHQPVSGRCGVASERFCVAQVDQSLD